MTRSHKGKNQTRTTTKEGQTIARIMLQSINSWLANQEPASRQRQCLLFLEEYHWIWGVNSCTHTTFWNHILHFLICMQQFWAQNTMSFVVPHPIFFFLVVVKTVIYLLLPYHPLQKNTCLRINGHIFLIKWWITIMLVSKWIWLYKPCKSVCSHKKAHVNTSSALEQTKGKRMGDTDLGAPSLLLASPKLRAGHLKVCRTWAIRSDLFTPHKKQTAMFIPDYSEMVFESS